MTNIIKQNLDYLVKETDKCRNCGERINDDILYLCIDCETKKTNKMNLNNNQ